MMVELAHIALLHEAPEAVDILSTCVRRTLAQGAVLIEPGSLDKVLFVVLSGGFDVHVDTLEQDAIASIGPGQHVGEVALIDGKPRGAWVVASESSEVLAVPELVFWDLVTRWPQVAINVLRSMAGQVRGGNMEVSESRRLQAEYRRHASFDALTGLYNRRWLADVLPRQVERSRGSGEALSVVMVDVDHFKRFNDTYGHAAGDYVLFAVGKRLQRSFRPTDLVARYGGEEFAVILPRTGGENGCIAAERVRRAVASELLVLEDGTEVRVTVSMGVAALAPGQSAHQLLQAADRGLYQAKGAGRNRVATWGGIEPVPLPGLF
jgi:diguanylate cyclase (GGDEF)-like protein